MHREPSKHTNQIPLIPVDKPRIGEKYHLSWAKSHGMVWKLKAIEGDEVILETPRTKKILKSKLSDLREIRRNEPH